MVSVSQTVRADCPDTITPSPFWRSDIAIPGDPFAQNNNALQPDWIKFTIRTCDEATVYFQDSNAHAFHYDFVTELMDPYVGIGVQAFEQIALYESGQELILGAVLYPAAFGPAAGTPEYGIQLIRRDPYTAQEVVDLFWAVRDQVDTDPQTQAFYFPTFEQLPTALENEAFLASQGVLLGSPARWVAGNACYASGWTLGRLKFIASDVIDQAFLDGTLGVGDILLTDAVPASVPLVAGVATLSPATPNSHVVILARTFGVPFVHLASQDDAMQAQALDGRRVIMRVRESFNTCDVRLIDVEDQLDEQTIDELLALREPSALALEPTAHFGAISTSVQGLQPADIRFTGGKAANFALIRDAVADQSPVAMALTFDLWRAFLDQPFVGGGTSLRDEITILLSPHTYPPSSMAALAADLATVRSWIEDPALTDFAAPLANDVLDALQDPQFAFNPASKIRFRSSTNVEDSAQFTGAGLYDSRSGCLLDDLDGDDLGPSACDPQQPEERGVFRAIRRVFASFFNDNAYLERMRHQVPGDDVGMAVLVHHSFPDELEGANGVATLDNSVQPPRVTLVTQAGAASVTNPQPGTVPEEVTGFVFGPGNTSLILVSSSNLVVLGATVLEWTAEYTELIDLLLLVSEAYEQATGNTDSVLDFEYKKLAPGGDAVAAGGLIVKQVRSIPQPDTAPNITPFLVNDAQPFEAFQNEVGQVFGVHRVKTDLVPQARNMWLTPENLADGLYEALAFSYSDGCGLQTYDGPFSGLAGASSDFDGVDTVVQAWTLPQLANPRSYTVTIPEIPLAVSENDGPIITLGDLGLPATFSNDTRVMPLHVEHAEPVLFGGGPAGNEDDLHLIRRAGAQPGHIEREQTVNGPLGESITTRYTWRPELFGVGEGTHALAFFNETSINGLTTEDIVLTGLYSQSYQPGHHAFSEFFLFEPRLEEGISPQILRELDALEIAAIHVMISFGDPEVTYYASGAIANCLCSASADCADADGDGIRDDGCVWWACTSGICEGTAVTYADFGGGNGACAPDGAADGNDRFHALNCFSNQTTTGLGGYLCEPDAPAASNVDAAGLGAPCSPDGVCDGNDAFAALNAFDGTTTCSCSPAPAGLSHKRPLRNR